MPGRVPFRRAAVAGLGVSGLAAAQALLELGLEVSVSDPSTSAAVEERAGRLRAMGAQVSVGKQDLSWLGAAELLVSSPGIPAGSELILGARERGIEVWSEIELGSRLSSRRIVAITGTNGKTTTTALVTAILGTAGFEAVSTGNIGYPLCDAARSAPEDAVLVCEVSSFQLALISEFRPQAGVLLNVGEDHYDWHSGHEDYLRSKARITLNQGPGELFVFNAGDEGASGTAGSSRARLAPFSPQRPEAAGEADASAFVEDGWVVLSSSGKDEELMQTRDIRLSGRHNLENVLAACLVAREVGAGSDAIASGVSSFEGLAHRTQLVGEVDGVRYIDDSKATNPHATLRALDGLQRVVLVAGGRAKGLDLSALSPVSAQLCGLVVMGEAAGELEGIFEGVATARAGSVEEAVAAAAGMARPGDTVLLSPACSSLDQYSGYAERGERFAAAVGRLAR